MPRVEVSRLQNNRGQGGNVRKGQPCGKSTFRPVKLCDNVNAWMNPPKMARREITNGHGFCWRRFCSASCWRFYGWAMLRTAKRKNAILALRCRGKNVRAGLKILKYS